MTITVHIEKGYKGQCAMCDENEARHPKYLKFSTPVPAIIINGEVIVPEAKGCTMFVCDDCKDKEWKGKAA